MSASTVALLIIGQEFINGKAVDENAAYAAKKLYDIGVKLQKIVIIPDDKDIIAENVKELSQKHDFVITCGGIGPTHGDVTVAGVAQALGQQVIRHSYLESVVSRHFHGANLTAAQRRLAEVPEQANLLVLNSEGEGRNNNDESIADEHCPQIYVGNIYLMPGLPISFRHHLDNMLSIFKGVAIVHDEITVKGVETKLTAALNRTLAACPSVKIGSYPSFEPDNPTSFIVKITLEADNQEELQAAKQFLLEALPQDMEIINN